MRTSRPVTLVLAAALVLAATLLAACSGAQADGSRPKLATWPTSVPDTVHGVMSAKTGGKLHSNAFGVETTVIFPPGALAEDTEVELVPFASAPVKDGKPNFADGVFVRRVGDGVGATLELLKPAEISFTAAKATTPGLTVGRWRLAQAVFEPAPSTVKTQGSATTVTAKLTTLAGMGARDPSAPAAAK